MTSLENKTVLITGGTGSFGKSFVKYILENEKPAKVVILSRDEFKQYHMQKELNDSRLRFFLGDIRDLSRLRRAFNGVDVVIHAAALKQVPALEYNPAEAVHTNITGTQNVIDAALDNGVEKVVFISTDKAAYPANLYGSTKLCAEKLCVAANSYGAGKTIFSVVRYGNVLGSRGSIVESLLKNDKTVHVTDPTMTRFWISLKDACRLVMFALENMVGGEIFIPKIASMKLGDLVKTLVPSAEQKIIGLRPGEKMHEILVTHEESAHAADLKDYYVILPEFAFWDDSSYKKYFEIGSKVNEAFAYTSDSNSAWLTPDELKKMLQA